MKKLLPLLHLLLIVACNDDEHKNYPMGIEGTWKLVKVVNGFSGYAQVFSPGEILWTFDETGGKITVTNNAEANVYSVLASGTYGYAAGVNQGVCNNYISLTNTENPTSLGCVSATSNELIINNGYADGDTYILTRQTFLKNVK